MVRIVLIFFFSFHFIPKATVINIDNSRQDQIKLSQLVSKVTPISFHGDKMPVIRSIKKVILEDKFIFITDEKVINSKPTGRLLQFDRAGKFIRQVGDSINGSITLTCNDDEKFLFMGTFDDVHAKKYDYDGKYISTVTTTFNNAYFYKGEYWKTQDNNSRLELVKFKSETPGDSKKIYVFSSPSYIKPPTGNVTFLNKPQFSNSGSGLYVSNRLENIVYRLSDAGVEPAFQIKVVGAKISEYDRTVFTDQFVTNRFLHYEYFAYMNSCVLIYDFKTKSSYHLKNQNNKSGIEDDITKTGFVRIKPLNNPEYIYFVATAEQLRGKADGLKNGPNPILFLGQIKDLK